MKIKKGPWTVVGSKTVYTNPWLSVREDQVIQPDENEGIYSVVELIHGVGVLPMDDEGNVYLSKEYHFAVERVTTEIFGGGIDEGEDILAAAKRELKEEAGIIAKKWTPLGFIDPFTSAVHSPNYIYLAQDLEFQESELEGTETLEMIKVPFEEAVQMVLDSTITHGASVAAILKAKIRLK